MALSSIYVIIGSMFTAYIFGNMVEAMKALNKKHELQQHQETIANTTMRAIKMPLEQQQKVIEYMDYIHQTADVEQEVEKFYSLLSTTLRKQVLFKIHKTKIDRIQILKDCDSVEKSFIISNLQISIYMADDEVCRQGEEGDELYFINRGAVKVQISKIEYELSNNYLDCVGVQNETLKQ